MCFCFCFSKLTQKNFDQSPSTFISTTFLHLLKYHLVAKYGGRNQEPVYNLALLELGDVFACPLNGINQ